MPLDSLYRSDSPVVDALKYTSLILTLLGLVGNSLSLITVTSKHCKKSSFTLYLGALAVVDSCVLILTLVQTWVFTAYEVDLGQYGAVTCKFFLFSLVLLSAVSSWLVIAVTAERVAATTYPHRFKTIYSACFGIRVVGILFVCMSLLFAHLLYGMEYTYVEQHPLCVYVDSAYKYFKRYFFVWIDSIIFFVLPIIIITAGNIVILIKVRNSRKQIAPVTSNTQAAKRTSRHLVIITLLISSTFIVLTMPACVFLNISRIIFDESNDAQRQIAFTIVSTLMRLNFSTNFYLYILSGHRFRDLFKSAISCNRRIQPASLSTKGHRSTAGTTGTTVSSNAPA